jgi:exopolysaccharide biosynthesis polyprenyl glycosylphosphotransferase
MKRFDLFFTAILIPLDYLILISAAAAAYSLRFAPIFEEIRPVTFDLTFNEYMNAAMPIALVWLGIFALSGLYAIRAKRIATEAARIILAASTGIAVILAIAFFSRELFESRFIILALWILTTLFIATERILIRMLQRSLRKAGIGMQYVILIGKTKSAHQLRSFFSSYPKFGYQVVAQFSQFNDTTAEKILSLKHQNQADIILIANPDADKKEILKAKNFSDIEHLNFIYSADLFPGSVARPIFHTFAGQPVIEVPKTPLDGWGAIYKRVFDIIVSSLLILFTLPLQLIAALAIIVENPGPILFFQKRVGQGGKKFTYFKFRSMVRDAHKYRFDPEFIKKHGNMREGTPLFKLEHDPRVTKIGKILRKFSIDEIPEFYLVFLGKMSLVGPRPHMPEEVADYKPWQRKVLTIKPGITGMAQISGRANLEFNEEIKLDQHYIENWNPLTDIIILLKTPFAVVEKLG